MSQPVEPAPTRNRIRALWAQDKPEFSLIVTIPSVPAVQVLANQGFDSFVIDMEHGLIDVEAAHALITATAGTPAVPWVRIPWNLPWIVKPLLDAGAFGITFPMIRSREEAERAVASVRYPPRGERNWGPFYAPLRWGLSMPEYMRAADDDIIVCLLIEHVDAIRNIGEILSVPGVDLAVIGPGDLATSMGYHNQVEHPEVQAVVTAAEEAILASGVKLGGPARSAEHANRLIARGYRHIGLGFDWTMLVRGAAAAFDGINR